MFIKLRQMRKGSNAQAQTMAQLLGLATKAAYYKKEAGMTKFTLGEAKRISDYFGMPIEELFFDCKVSDMETSGFGACEMGEEPRVRKEGEDSV